MRSERLRWLVSEKAVSHQCISTTHTTPQMPSSNSKRDGATSVDFSRAWARMRNSSTYSRKPCCTIDPPMDGAVARSS